MINIKKLFTNILTKLTALETSKAPLASPALTGTPTAPTAAAGNNTTQIATTAFVNSEIAEDVLGRGEEIPANADLDDYTTDGVFYCPDSTRTATLTNPPTTGAGFKIYVGQITTALNNGNYMYQLAIMNTALVFIRYKGAVDAVWGAWKEFAFTSQLSDTKNTAGSTDTSSKIFLIGATSQGANPQTYSHDTAYVGTDGCLYSGGSKVLTSYTDTKNTAGATNTSSKIFLIGATSQGANPQTYSQDTAYVGTDGCLYSNGAKVATGTIPSASSTTPKMDGTAAVGTGTTWARADHVHPVDTSRANSSHTHSYTNDQFVTVTPTIVSNTTCPLSTISVRKAGCVTQVWATGTFKANTSTSGSGWVDVATGLPKCSYGVVGWFGCSFGKSPEWARYQVTTDGKLQVARYGSHASDTTTNIDFCYVSNVRN